MWSEEGLLQVWGDQLGSDLFNLLSKLERTVFPKRNMNALKQQCFFPREAVDTPEK